MLGTQDILLILVVLLLLFGPNKLPEIARSLGKMIGEFKKAQIESENELKKEINPINDKNLEKNIDKNIDRELKIRKLAIEMGIKTENKTTVQIIDEIRSKINEQKNSGKEQEQIGKEQISLVKNEK